MLFILPWLSLFLASRAGAQPEQMEPEGVEERAVIGELRRALAEREEALAEARRQLEELEARLREMQERAGGEPRLVRVFPLTPAVQEAGDRLEPVGELPEATFVLLPKHLAVWGPASVVDAVAQVLAALDPATQPLPVTLTVRAYLAAEELPPDFTAPEDDPLLTQVRERTGYAAVALLTVKTLPGVEGELLSTESEMGVEGDWGELHGALQLTVMPHLIAEEQVQLKVKIGLELTLGPGGIRRLGCESTLRTRPGQPALIVSEDPVLRSALVLALTLTLGE